MSGYGIIPRWIVTDGMAAELTASELRVFIVIAAHVDSKKWKAFPAIETLARLTGKSERTVQRAVQALVNRGAMRVQPGGGRGKANVYFLARNPVTQDDTVSSDQTPSPKLSPFAQENPVKSDPKPRQTETETPSKRDLNPVTQGVTPTTEQQEQPNNRRVGEVAGGEGMRGRNPNSDSSAGSREVDAAKALRAVGIRAPTKVAELSASPAITAELVHGTWDRVRTGGGEGGALVAALERIAAEHAMAENSRIKGEQRRADEVAERRAADELVKTEREAVQAVLDRHTETERDGAWEKALADFEPGAARLAKPSMFPSFIADVLEPGWRDTQPEAAALEGRQAATG